MAADEVFTVVLGILLSLLGAGEGDRGPSATCKALKHSPPRSMGTWAILDRDGANRHVEPYLSSLGGGESGTGVIVSPPFRVAGEKIAFTICGHDGPRGGQKKNFLALVDAQTGDILKQTVAPSCDPMQERSWDVGPLRGREVRVQVHDGDSGGAFAWIGIGRIDAGDAQRVDFRRGMPQGWTARLEPSQQRTEIVRDGVPFLRYPSEYTMIPSHGARELACGFAAQRLYVLGCTVPSGKPTEVYGTIEIVYRQGPSERFPLMYGYTLDLAGKMLSKSKAMHLHESADPFQHYLVLAPRAGVIEKIILRRDPQRDVVPRITAITCQTQAESANLEPLPDIALDAAQAAWIGDHAITAASPKIEQIVAEIRRAYKLE